MATTEIVLGSGTLYVMPFSGTMPAKATIAVEANILGYIKGGASIEYKVTDYDVKDDSGKINERFAIDHEATFKSGLLTWNAETLSKVMSVGTYVDDTENELRTITLGSKGVEKMKKFVIRFEVSDGSGLGFNMVGTNSKGFSFTFAKDKETVEDVEFKGIAYNDAGNILSIDQTYTA